MNDDDITNKLYTYYNKAKSPKYIVNDWVIVDDETFIKHRNKLIISNICSNHYDDVKLQKIVVFESKKKYYAVKYSNNFICLRESDTEYGLVIGEYDLIAMNKSTLYDKTNDTNLTFINVCKLMGWKLNKQAKEYIEYFK